MAYSETEIQELHQFFIESVHYRLCKFLKSPLSMNADFFKRDQASNNFMIRKNKRQLLRTKFPAQYNYGIFQKNRLLKNGFSVDKISSQLLKVTHTELQLYQAANIWLLVFLQSQLKPKSQNKNTFEIDFDKLRNIFPIDSSQQQKQKNQKTKYYRQKLNKNTVTIDSEEKNPDDSNKKYQQQEEEINKQIREFQVFKQRLRRMITRFYKNSLKCKSRLIRLQQKFLDWPLGTIFSLVDQIIQHFGPNKNKDSNNQSSNYQFITKQIRQQRGVIKALNKRIRKKRNQLQLLIELRNKKKKPDEIQKEQSPLI